jgi:anaerobic magnesium-protoporphyrin IX monomethyl ester cyclase
MKKRVLLVDPPWYRLFGGFLPRIPIGPGYLAGVLEQAGHEATVYMADYDADAERNHTYFRTHDLIVNNSKYTETLSNLDAPIWGEVREVMRKLKPDVVGVSVMTGKYGSGLNIARIAKQLGASEGRDVKVIFGGPHATAMPAEVAREDCIDVVFKREAERSLIEWIERIDRPETWRDVQGLTFVDRKSGELVDTGFMPFIPDLDALPMQARHLVHDKQHFPSMSFGYLFASRGCPYACNYCSSKDTWTRKIRYISPKRVVDEIEHCYQTYGTRFFSFEDDVFPFDRDHALAVCDDIVARGLKIEWTCETRVNSITAEIAQAIRRAGCSEVKLGVETGDQEILKWINKRASLDQARIAAQHLHDAGVEVATFFMVGFPDETEETMFKSFEFMKSLAPGNICFSKATPYPGTELYEICMREGLLEGKLDWGQFFHQSDALHIMKSLTRERYNELAGRLSSEVDKYNQRAWAAKNVKSPGKLIGKAARYLVSDPKAFLRKSASYLFNQGVEREPG